MLIDSLAEMRLVGWPVVPLRGFKAVCFAVGCLGSVVVNSVESGWLNGEIGDDVADVFFNRVKLVALLHVLVPVHGGDKGCLKMELVR